ncbi:MAG: DUF4388 domain-containing protein [Blastochloris sp.]|nr:DUF4388 domain-containing protein [Blastochloris sp.]
MEGTITLHSGVQVTDLLQMLSGGHLTGHLHLKGPDDTPGSLEFNSGHVCRIHYSQLSGVSALARLLKEPRLTFRFEVGAVSSHDPLRLSTTELLMDAALQADTQIHLPGTQSPTYFTIKNRKVLNSESQEEAHEILAEFDYLNHHAFSAGNALGLGQPHKILLKEDQALLAFHIRAQDDVMGYQSLNAGTLAEAFQRF